MRPAILLISACGLACAADEYLFTSFRGNGEDGLHLAISRDGYRWEALSGDRSFLRPSQGRAN